MGLMRKRRMPDERIAEIVSRIDFDDSPDRWFPKLEACFHKILKYEYYLTHIPDNLSHPRYRRLITRVVYRLLNQIDSPSLSFSGSIRFPDPLIKRFIEFLIKAELRRKQEMIRRNPVTMDGIRAALTQLKRKHEI